MANTLEYNEIVILDRLPTPIHLGALPSADAAGEHFTNSSHTTTTVAKFQPGYKVSVYDSTEQGWTVLAYLNFISNPDTPANTGAGEICVPTDTTNAQYKVSSESDSGDAALNAYIAIGLGSMTTTYWYWFWVGGVAPTSFCTTLAATSTILLTDGNVDRTEGLTAYDNTGNNQVGLKPTASALTSVAWALADDAT